MNLATLTKIEAGINDVDKSLVRQRRTASLHRVFVSVLIATFLYFMSAKLEADGLTSIANLIVNIAGGLYGAAFLFFFVEKSYADNEQHFIQMQRRQTLSRRLLDIHMQLHVTPYAEALVHINRSLRLQRAMIRKTYPNRYEMLKATKNRLEKAQKMLNVRKLAMNDQLRIIEELKDIGRYSDELKNQLEIFHKDTHEDIDSVAKSYALAQSILDDVEAERVKLALSIKLESGH